MEIDFAATKHNMRLIRLSRYAEDKGISGSTLRRILDGNYGPYRGPRYDRIIQLLKEDGFLVLKGDADLAA